MLSLLLFLAKESKYNSNNNEEKSKFRKLSIGIINIYFFCEKCSLNISHQFPISNDTASSIAYRRQHKSQFQHFCHLTNIIY